MDKQSCGISFKEKENLKVFTAKVCKTYRRQHLIQETVNQVQC